MQLSLKFDLRAPAFGADPADLYAAALEMCSWADTAGFDCVRFLEHHGSDDGYCPSPLVMAAAAAARTSRIRIRVRALILPLHDPLRIAEDAAVVDVISRGRLELVVAAGYVQSEFAMFGRALADRPVLVEEGVQVLKQAWTGEPFDYHGRPALVALRPHRRPRPPIVLGGSSPAAARRAARIADGFEPTSRSLYALYAAECARLGVAPGPPLPPSPRGQFLYVSEDPERSWRELGPHLLHEMRSYGAWLAGAGNATNYRPVADIGELRASGTYQILTPGECVDLATELGPEGQLEFHPLVGGAHPALGWRCLTLFEKQVAPGPRVGRPGDREERAMTVVDLSGHVVIVTGAGRGLGRAHARSLSSRGALVVVNDLAREHAEAVAAEIKKDGGTAVASSNSVTDPAGGQAIVEEALAAFGTVDAVVNNAGFLRNADFEEQTPDTLTAQLNVHVAGPFFLTQAAWPIMRAKGYGRVVMTSWPAAFSPWAASRTTPRPRPRCTA